jgi:hypothetical protein
LVLPIAYNCAENTATKKAKRFQRPIKERRNPDEGYKTPFQRSFVDCLSPFLIASDICPISDWLLGKIQIERSMK